MERESLLTLLILLLGGLMLMLVALLQQLHAWGRARRRADTRAEAGAVATERSAWRALAAPVTPALLVASALCGWALAEPDPVPQRVGVWVLLATVLPFAVVVGRAALRAAWALVGPLEEAGVATAGLVRPQIVCSPQLARELDERLLNAALEHERAHVRHRDPLRIWIAQMLADLQWPWPQARQRLNAWLAAIERARDEEARTRGIEGADLAAAVLATLRFRRASSAPCARGGASLLYARATISGEQAALQARISALLAPLPASAQRASRRVRTGRALLFGSTLLVALVLGATWGPALIGSLLTLT